MSNNPTATLRNPGSTIELLTAGLNSLKAYALCILSHDGTVEYCSQGIEFLFGYPTEKLLGNNISVLWPNINCIANFESLLKAASTHGTQKTEIWLQRSDESLFWASVMIAVVSSTQPNHQYSLIISDRTQEHEQEALLRKTEERYQYVLEGVHAAIWDWDVQRDTCYWSSNFLKLFGISPNDPPIFDTALSRIHPEDQHKVAEMMQLHLANPAQEYEVEYRIVQPSGDVRYCLSRGRAIRDAHGKPLRVVGAVIDITQQKQAEAKIKQLNDQLEKRFSATFQQAAVGFAHVSLDTKWLRVNTKLCEILGYSEQELTQMTYDDITYPEDHVIGKANTQRVLRGEIATYYMEKRYIRKDGIVIWVNITVSLVRDEQNNPEYFICVIEDITQRKNDELKLQQTFLKLQESEARLKCVIDSNIAGIVFWDMDTNIIQANDTYLEIIGYSREDLQKGILKRGTITAPEYHAQDKAILEKLAIEGFVNNYEKQYIRKDGQRIYVLLNHILLDKNGSHDEGVSFVVDITERKRAEQALFESEQRFRRMADEAPIMLWLTDEKGKTLYANRCWLDFVGLSLEDYMGHFRFALDVLHPDDKQKSTKVFSDAVTNQNSYSHEMHYKRTDGKYRWIHVTANPRFTPSGEFLGHVGVCQDITESKEARENLKKFARELEMRVDERTREIQAINKELEAFSYSVSHDLRAPLRSIDGFSNIIASRYASALDETGKEYFRFIRENTQRMGQLIDDLLLLSRITRAELDMQDINLSKIAHEITEYIQLHAPNRHVNFLIAPELYAKGDPRLLRILLDNLLGNAWKFTSKIENAVIEFSMYKENEQTVFFIRDNGAGFDMKFIDKLFGAFQRLHSMNEFPGTGIGLATVLRIINRHKGQVWATGEVGKGATFSFTLPDSE